jgi:hypothetical protein
MSVAVRTPDLIWWCLSRVAASALQAVDSRLALWGYTVNQTSELNEVASGEVFEQVTTFRS